MNLLHIDAFDRAAFDRARAASPALAEQLRAGLALYPSGFEALALDVFALFFKLNLARRAPEASWEGRTALARQVLDGLTQAPELAALRQETALDEARATFAATRALAWVLQRLTQHGAGAAQSLGDEARLAEAEARLEELEAQRDALHAMSEAREDLDPDALHAVQEDLRDAIQGATQERRALLQQQRLRLDRQQAQAQTALRDVVSGLPARMEQAAAYAKTHGAAFGADGAQDATAALELGEELAHNPALKRLADLTGAFRDYARGLRTAPLERRPAEVHHITLGDDLSRALPAEQAMLLHPTLRLEVLRRMTERQLLQVAVRGDDKAGRGPVVICLDGSGSMRGEKETWAKAVALTLLDLARRQRRAVEVITFAGQPSDLRRFALAQAPPRGASLAAAPVRTADVLAFARYFPNGGTDFQQPLDAALAALQRDKALRGGDIVLITDGEAHLSDVWLKRFLEAKRRLECSIYAVLVDVGQQTLRPDTVARFADRVTSVRQLTAENARDLFLKLGG